MPTIEVTCDCGRVYVLPADKEGRKLQCRRCGAVLTIRRDAAPGIVIPFKEVSLADESDEATKDRAPTHPAGQGTFELKPLPEDDPKPTLRRCRRCGLQDEARIPTCVRCGYEFRINAAPPLVQTKSAARISSEVPRLEREQDARIARIEALAKISFVPLAGLVAAALAVGFSALGNRPLKVLPAPSRKALESRLGTARLMAVATSLIWCGLIAFYVAVYRPERRREIRETLAQGCRAHLESLGHWIAEARRGGGRFPANPRKTIGEGLRELADEHDLGDAVLSCPVLGGERYVLDGGLSAIDGKTSEDYLILWDPGPHAETDGGLRWYALRADGRVEEFRSMAQLDAARARASERGDRAPATPDGNRVPAPMPKPLDPNPSNPMSQGFERYRRALAELDARDPKGETRLAESEFERTVGTSPDAAATAVQRYGDDDIKHATARILARLDVPGPEMLRLANLLERDADSESRGAFVRGLRRAGAPAWIAACGALAADGLPPASDEAAALLAAEARSGKDGLKRVLLCARDQRRLSKTAPDQPIFPLPTDIYESATQLLGDEEVGAEALAVLSRGTVDVETALAPAFEHRDVHVREMAFRALRANLSWRNAPRTALHMRVKEETDRNLRAAVLALLMDSVDVELIRRALEALREGSTNDPLATLARRILERGKDLDSLNEIVRELDRSTSSRGDALAELRRPDRLLDETASEALARKGPLLEATGQEAVVALAALRFDDASHALLVRLASVSPSAGVREAAWRALLDGARLSGKMRTAVQEELVARLPKETDPGVKTAMFELLGRYEYRSASTLVALDQFARKASEKDDMREKAIHALSLSNEPRAVTMLVDLIDAIGGHPKWFTTFKLRELTGAASQPTTTPEWRRLVHQGEAEVKRKLKERDERDRAELKAREDRVDERLKELRGHGA